MTQDLKNYVLVAKEDILDVLEAFELEDEFWLKAHGQEKGSVLQDNLRKALSQDLNGMLVNALRHAVNCIALDTAAPKVED